MSTRPHLVLSKRSKKSGGIQTSSNQISAVDSSGIHQSQSNPIDRQSPNRVRFSLDSSRNDNSNKSDSIPAIISAGMQQTEPNIQTHNNMKKSVYSLDTNQPHFSHLKSNISQRTKNLGNSSLPETSSVTVAAGGSIEFCIIIISVIFAICSFYGDSVLVSLYKTMTDDPAVTSTSFNNLISSFTPPSNTTHNNNHSDITVHHISSYKRCYDSLLLSAVLSSPADGVITSSSEVRAHVEGVLMFPDSFGTEFNRTHANIYLDVTLNDRPILFPGGNNLSVTLSGSIDMTFDLVEHGIRDMHHYYASMGSEYDGQNTRLGAAFELSFTVILLDSLDTYASSDRLLRCKSDQLVSALATKTFYYVREADNSYVSNVRNPQYSKDSSEEDDDEAFDPDSYIASRFGNSASSHAGATDGTMGNVNGQESNANFSPVKLQQMFDRKCEVLSGDPTTYKAHLQLDIENRLLMSAQYMQLMLFIDNMDGVDITHLVYENIYTDVTNTLNLKLPVDTTIDGLLRQAATQNKNIEKLKSNAVVSISGVSLMKAYSATVYLCASNANQPFSSQSCRDHSIGWDATFVRCHEAIVL